VFVKGRSALRIRKGFLAAVLAAFLPLLSLVAPASAAENKYAAMVVDANSGRVLFSRNADASRYPASLTKMMTLYLLFEELDAKRLTLKSQLSVSANAARQPPSKLGLRAGSTIAVEDAILALVTKSANDVAVVVAENVGGSVDSFAQRMTRTAHALGMSRTTYRNPHGLPDSRQTTTAHDLVRLGQALQDRFPTYYAYFGTKSFTYRGARHRNHNHLLGSVAGVDGIKTGYTRDSGFNLVTNVERDGRHIIAVVMGGKTAKSRDAHMRELIATYLPKATRGARATPLLIVDTAGPHAAAGAHADPRLPRSRPDVETEDAAVLAYAATDASHDVVGLAMAEAEAGPVHAAQAGAAQADAAQTDTAQGDIGEEPEDDPIIHRIEVASTVAESADFEMKGADDPIGRLTQLARIRAGVQELVASAPATSSDIGESTDGWNIQIGATPTAEGAQALLEKAQSTMGTVLASVQPVTQEIDHRGTTLYRARFAGFSDQDEAREACAKLKRKDFSCLAIAN
jgi:D-alanyl-D-alanine carboxypeptidase